MNSLIQPAAWDFITRQPPFNTRPNGLLEDVYLFVYTHHFRPNEFLQRHAGAQFIGGAWLKGWEWYLTGCRVPNIRPIIHGDNKVGTPGYVFRVSSDIEHAYYASFRNYHNFPTNRFNCVYDNDRIRSAQRVIVTTNGSKPLVGAKPIRVITYWDPKSKESLGKARSRGMSTIEKKRWMHGLKELEKHAFPRWVMQHCYQELWRPDLQEKRYKMQAKRKSPLFDLQMVGVKGAVEAEDHARRHRKTTHQTTMACLPTMSLISLPTIEAARAVHDRIDASLVKLHKVDLVHQPEVRPTAMLLQRVDGALAKFKNLKPAARQSSIRVAVPTAKKASGLKVRKVGQSTIQQYESYDVPLTECLKKGQAAPNFRLKENQAKAKKATAKNMRVLQLQSGI